MSRSLWDKEMALANLCRCAHLAFPIIYLHHLSLFLWLALIPSSFFLPSSPFLPRELSNSLPFPSPSLLSSLLFSPLIPCSSIPLLRLLLPLLFPHRRHVPNVLLNCACPSHSLARCSPKALDSHVYPSNYELAAGRCNGKASKGEGGEGK